MSHRILAYRRRRTLAADSADVTDPPDKTSESNKHVVKRENRLVFSANSNY